MNFVQRSSGAACGCWSWRTRLLDVVTLGFVSGHVLMCGNVYRLSTIHCHLPYLEDGHPQKKHLELFWSG